MVTGATAGLSGHPAQPSSKVPFRARKLRKHTTAVKSQHPLDPPSPNPITISVVSNGDSQTGSSSKPTILLPRIIKSLSYQNEIDVALSHLRASDPLLVSLINIHRSPSFPSSNRPFLSLSKSIIYQQLSTKAGKSIYDRFEVLCGGESSVSPEIVLALTVQQLREVGISGGKASYLHDLANRYKLGVLSDDSILEMDDESLHTMLTAVKGIGTWSVHMFMIFSLHRPDVLPVGDLGVRKGVQMLYKLGKLPQSKKMEEICEKWKPYRSVGAWYMWRLVEAKGTSAVAAPVVLADAQG